MKQAEQAFVAYIRRHRPEFSSKTDMEVIELTRFDVLMMEWHSFCSGWNAAFAKSKEVEQSVAEKQNDRIQEILRILPRAASFESVGLTQELGKLIRSKISRSQKVKKKT